MKLARPALAIALAGSVAGVGVAHAAAKPKPKPKPICQFLKDAVGDGNGHDTAGISPFPINGINSPVPMPAVAGGPSTDALDITSADIAGDKKNLTVVIRTKKLAAKDTSAPTGMRWALGFTAEETVFTLAAHTDPTGKISFDAAHYDPIKGGLLYGGGATGTFDTAKSEIHITVPTSLLATEATIKPGAVLSDVFVNAAPEVAIVDATGKVVDGAFFETTLTYSDTATAAAPFKVGTATCVTPGK